MFDDKLAVTLGLRYTEEQKDIKYLYQNAGSPFYPVRFPYLRTNPDYTGELMPTAGQYDVRTMHSSATPVAMRPWLTMWARPLMSTCVTQPVIAAGVSTARCSTTSMTRKTIETLELGFKSDVIPGGTAGERRAIWL